MDRFYGDGPNGGTRCTHKEAPQDAASLATFKHSQSGSEWLSYGFAIDFSTAPGFVGEFGEISFGDKLKPQTQMCVTTNGFVFFDDGTVCNPDARDADGHNWQGFAIGATVQGEQDVRTEMVYINP